jgi:hypothetical protein
MKGIALSVLAAFAVMAGPMALAGQAHGDHDKDKDDAHHHHQTAHTNTRTIHHRGGTQTITYYHHPRGDKDHDKDDRKPRHHHKKHHAKHSKSWFQAVKHRK